MRFRRVVGDAQRALGVESRPRERLGLAVTAFFDDDAGESDDEAGRRRTVATLLIENVKQGLSRERLGLAQPSLLGHHSRYRQQAALRGLQNLLARRRIFDSFGKSFTEARRNASVRR